MDAVLDYLEAAGAEFIICKKDLSMLRSYVIFDVSPLDYTEADGVADALRSRYETISADICWKNGRAYLVWICHLSMLRI
ncbi:MAG: hypothetical protein HY518_00800 [Candidatus Aenigmarchaeota archaeon]|nr:hypothetical protein [Candidatus Aenigmarchaeota archaeon]